jgi:ribonuclease VapC
VNAIDASALLAFLLGEPGGELVQARLPRSWISSVNLAETLSRLNDLEVQATELPLLLRGYGVRLSAFGADEAVGVAELRRKTRSLGLSLGDGACIQLARAKRVPALTADRAWSSLDVGVEIELIR